MNPLAFLAALATLLVAMPTRAGETPNKYHLQGGMLRVTYATTSISGKPRLTYQSSGRILIFTGEEIRRATSELGTLVTVSIKTIPDASSTTFSILLPNVNLDARNNAPMSTVGITTVHRTSIGGPGMVKGQVDTYTTTALKGTATFFVP